MWKCGFIGCGIIFSSFACFASRQVNISNEELIDKYSGRWCSTIKEGFLGDLEGFSISDFNAYIDDEGILNFSLDETLRATGLLSSLEENQISDYSKTLQFPFDFVTSKGNTNCKLYKVYKKSIIMHCKGYTDFSNDYFAKFTLKGTKNNPKLHLQSCWRQETVNTVLKGLGWLYAKDGEVFCNRLIRLIPIYLKRCE